MTARMGRGEAEGIARVGAKEGCQQGWGRKRGDSKGRGEGEGIARERVKER